MGVAESYARSLTSWSQTLCFRFILGKWKKHHVGCNFIRLKLRSASPDKNGAVSKGGPSPGMASDKPAAVIVDLWSRDDPRMFQADQTDRLDYIEPPRISKQGFPLWSNAPQSTAGGLVLCWVYLWISVPVLSLSSELPLSWRQGC